MSSPRSSNKKSPEREHETCFYCGALVARNDRELDHFPVPESAGGTELVCACKTCHGMKDRFNLGDWPLEWVLEIVSDFPRLNRGTKLFLAKALRLYADTRATKTNV